MISCKTITYASGDISTIENYESALMDNTQVWKVFHRNTLTGVGRITKQTLKGLGKYYAVSPSELIFLPKDHVKFIEETKPMTNKDLHRCHVVFHFWSKLHPHKLFSEITEEEFDEMFRSVRRLRVLFAQMNARCSNPNAQDYKWYGAKGVKICKEWLKDSDKFVLWALRQGYRYYPDKPKGEQLSIDRIDTNRNYSPANCRWIPHSKNCARTSPHNWGMIIDRLWKFAQKFPNAASIVFGRPVIDWKVVCEQYMNGDVKKVVKFLTKHGYSPMGIWRIRKVLGDVVPQKKSER